MANRTDDIIDRWVSEVRKTEPRFMNDNHTNICQDRKQIYSYGTHFPMARLMTSQTARDWFLVNGDLYSVSTSRHQSDTRGAIAQSGLKSMIVPFSAMREAGIDLDSIELVEVTPDTNEEITQTWERWEDLPHHMKYTTRTTTSVEYKVESCRNGPRGSLELYSWDGGKLVHNHIHENDYPGTDHFTPYTAYTYDEVRSEPGEDGLWTRTRTVHHLGQAVFRARYQSGTKPVRHWRMTPDYEAMRKRDNPDGTHGTHRLDWERPIEKRYYYTENQRVYKTAYFLSGYDENERGRTGQGLYFLAQLPEWSRPGSVAEAFEDLKPAEVRRAEAEGRHVVRQGDVFAFESHLRPATLKATGAERPGLNNEELQALARLRKRQGSAPERIPGMGKTERWVLGVNHTGTDVLVSPAGTTWVRGTLRHKRVSWTWEGAFAGLPEHKRVRLGDGKTWYHVVKNTVPVDADGRSRAWTVGGGVD